MSWVHLCCQGISDNFESTKFTTCIKCRNLKLPQPSKKKVILEKLAKFRKLFVYITKEIDKREDVKIGNSNDNLYFEQSNPELWHDTAKLLGLTFEEIVIFSQIMKDDGVLKGNTVAQNSELNTKHQKIKNEEKLNANKILNYTYNFSKSKLLHDYKNMLFSTNIGDSAFKKCSRRIQRYLN